MPRAALYIYIYVVNKIGMSKVWICNKINRSFQEVLKNGSFFSVRTLKSDTGDKTDLTTHRSTIWTQRSLQHRTT